MAKIVPKVSLKDILACQEIPEQLLIISDPDINYRGVLGCLICAHIQQGREIHYICYSKDPKECSADLPQKYRDCVVWYDLNTDPHGWNGDEAQAKRIKATWSSMVKLNNNKESVIIIDNLLHASRYWSSPQLAKSLQVMRQMANVTQVITSYVSGMPENVLSAAKHRCPCTLTMHCTDQADTMEVLVRKKSGKIFRTREAYGLNLDLTLKFVKMVDSKSAAATNDDNVSHETTFNLQLTEDQRKAKEQMVLPHQRVQSQTAKIHYIPEAEDDWDDEDPDEDLEI